MKYTTFMAVAVAGLVCGCNKPDPRVAELEARVSALEATNAAQNDMVMKVIARQEAIFDLATNTTARLAIDENFGDTNTLDIDALKTRVQDLHDYIANNLSRRYPNP